MNPGAPSRLFLVRELRHQLLGTAPRLCSRLRFFLNLPKHRRAINLPILALGVSLHSLYIAEREGLSRIKPKLPKKFATVCAAGYSEKPRLSPGRRYGPHTP